MESTLVVLPRCCSWAGKEGDPLEDPLEYPFEEPEEASLDVTEALLLLLLLLL